MAAPQLFVGLMSGTSLDGVDAALVEIGDDGFPTLRHAVCRPYPESLRGELLVLQAPCANELHEAAVLGSRLAILYAEAVEGLLADAKLSPEAIRAIGCHGQTVRHNPAAGYTLQIGNAALLAERTGIAVVADFRSRDIAAGGQGAPLVPACHDALFRDPARHRAILNIGGIANLTDLAPGRPVRGFDCGPGNLLLDGWAARHLGKAYDAGGRWGASGQVVPDLLARLQSHPFFVLPPPKSCGREQFNLAWLDSKLGGAEAPADVQATLGALTVDAAADALRAWCGVPDDIYVCGGGAHNDALMDLLAAALPQTRVATTDALGLPADWVESVAFAWLAHRTVAGLPGNLPEVTGAKGLRVLGAIYPA